MKPWLPNPYPTLGVEQEFNLIDAGTADLSPVMERIWQGVQGPLRQTISYELFLSILESSSPVARSVDELYEAVCRHRRQLAEAAKGEGARLAACGVHPFARVNPGHVVQTDHYVWVYENHGLIARRMLTTGLHVHVGLVSAEAALYVMHEMKRWAYPLMGLAANSAIFEGSPSGLACTRAHLFHSLPRTLLAPSFETFDELESLYDKLLAAGDITRPGDLWWTIRVQPPLGTIEYRIFDLPTDARRLAALAAVCQAASAHYQQEFLAGRPRTRLEGGYLEQNRWQAMRFGLSGKGIDAATGEILPMGALVGRLLDLITPQAHELGASRWVDVAREMIHGDTESQWQLREFERLNRDARLLTLEIASRTVPGE